MMRFRNFIPVSFVLMYIMLKSRWPAIKAWFGRKVVEWGIVADDETSRRLDAVDRELDYQEWFEREWKDR